MQRLLGRGRRNASQCLGAGIAFGGNANILELDSEYQYIICEYTLQFVSICGIIYYSKCQILRYINFILLKPSLKKKVVAIFLLLLVMDRLIFRLDFRELEELVVLGGWTSRQHR